jgi:CheY-like chemotaxis protein
MKPDGQAILLVEDDSNDVFFIKYAFESAGITNPVIVVEDGLKAVRYLAGEGTYADRVHYPLPCLVLLDLKLPGKTGLDVLRWIQNRAELRRLPVVVLTSSSNTADVDEAYALGARSFLVKPFSVEERLKLARAIKSFWFEWSQFPALGQA